MIDNFIIVCYTNLVDIHKMSNKKCFSIKVKNMNESIGIIKEIDNLGRIIIPKEYRKRLQLEKSVEVILTAEGILIRNPKYELVETENKKKHL